MEIFKFWVRFKKGLIYWETMIDEDFVDSNKVYLFDKPVLTVRESVEGFKLRMRNYKEDRFRTKGYRTYGPELICDSLRSFLWEGLIATLAIGEMIKQRSGSMLDDVL